MRHRHQLKSETRGARYKYIPSRELKCPTWGIRTSSSKVPAGRAYVSAQESIISINMKNAHTYREYSRCHRYIIYMCVCAWLCVVDYVGEGVFICYSNAGGYLFCVQVFSFSARTAVHKHTSIILQSSLRKQTQVNMHSLLMYAHDSTNLKGMSQNRLNKINSATNSARHR